jgi:hypothetical protein
MGAARKQYSPDEKRRILDLNEEGWTYKQIAEQIRPGVKSAWRSIGEIIRQEREKQAPTEEQSPQIASSRQSVMGRVPSTSKVTLPPGMDTSLSAKEMMLMLDNDQQAIFVATYEDLRGEADEEQLTRAENEMLIRAAFSNVKYLRAQQMLAKCESYLMMDLDGMLGDSDDDKAKKRLAGRGDAYKKEAEQWHKEYMELLNDLKLTRKQRLDKIKDTRNTFLDLQQELMKKVRQDSVIEEIKRINHATRDEFRRMAEGAVGPDGQRHPWLIGAFTEDEMDPPEEKADDNTA